MFRTDLLSIIRCFNAVYTATGICHASYVDCLLGRECLGQACAQHDGMHHLQSYYIRYGMANHLRMF
jgi:hypothetical protein